VTIRVFEIVCISLKQTLIKKDVVCICLVK
jgi:hypothetical protein